ncbi:alkaline phosphatase D family protein [Aureimonas psammosilenae]|uniref:alkaline phosphatase D family protein n=1 Tax=Aureimonas psammosilenae TaxID=2495496 RepID=UPI001AEE831C|nr:alkaline phosphatase D family protein [Aureimonas psammosilenae]
MAGAQEIAGRPIAEIFGWSAHAYDFALPARKGASYELGGRTYPVCADLSGDMRLAFVSCNGQEEGDADRPLEVRNRMWRRLLTEHGERPFSLLVQGGDQLYADEAMRSHPETARWKKAPNRKRPGIAFTPEMRLAARRWYAERYLRLAAEPAMAEIVARVPSMMMWDDHDIMDGWGSHPAAIQESPVGIGLFEVAREMFKLFQLGLGADEPMPLAPSPSEAGFTFGARFPGLSILVPDLRSERSLTRVMGPEGWRAFDRLLEDVGEGDRVVLVSTVPVLGPRLSVVERLLNKMPKAQDYEDDLRDQWQSYAHRLEWVRLLESLERVAQTRGAAVTVLSGEIHLATRGTMSFRGGAGELHQLVASGITHPEPSSLYAGGLGLLARFGESPVPGCPIRMRPLPGKSATYTAERNYLVLDRQGGRWTAEWELEKSGRTKSLAI